MFTINRFLNITNTTEPSWPYESDFTPPEGSVDSQIRQLEQSEIPQLLALLPYNHWHKGKFSQNGNRWNFMFESKFPAGRFFASTYAESPTEAFRQAKEILLNQIKNWRKNRFESEAHFPPIFNSAASSYAPRVLIIDDDEDIANLMDEALRRLGCETEIVLQYEDLYRKIAFSDAEFIFLDWKLNNNVTADSVMQKTTKLIDRFSDLQKKFSENRPHIITHSILDRNEITLPKSGRCYFDHLDHWQKPLPFSEFMQRMADVLLQQQWEHS